MISQGSSSVCEFKHGEIETSLSRFSRQIRWSLPTRSGNAAILLRDSHNLENSPLCEAKCVRCFPNVQSSAVIKRSDITDIRKTFGPLPDRRTGNHMENPSFTGPPKLLQDLIFFNIRIPIEGLPTGIFLPDRRTSTIVFSSVLHCFHRSRTEDRWVSQCLYDIALEIVY